MCTREVVGRLDAIERRLAALAAPREFLDIPEAAEFLGVSRQLLDQWRMERSGPAFHRVGRRVTYAIADLRAFMAARRVAPLAQ